MHYHLSIRITGQSIQRVEVYGFKAMFPILVVATGGVYKGQGRNQCNIMTCTYLDLFFWWCPSVNSNKFRICHHSRLATMRNWS